jgi:Secretion system C-terminal sorting domain
MQNLKRRILFFFLTCLFVLGMNVQQANAQIDTLEPVWVRNWVGEGNFSPFCHPFGQLVNYCPGNAWDVHVYRDTVFATGVKTDTMGLYAPLVLNAYSLDGDLLWDTTWAAPAPDFYTAAGAVVIGHGGYLYVGGVAPIDSMGASLIQKWDLNGNLIWSHGWGDKTDHGHHEVNGLAIVDTILYVSHYSMADGFVYGDAHIRKFDLNALNAGLSWQVAELWDREYGEPGTINTTDGHIYADSTGVVITGGFGAPAGSIVYQYGDSYLIKFDPQGDTSWIKTYTGNGCGGVDNGFNLKSDGNHIYVTGPTAVTVNILGLPIDGQVFVQKYTMAGDSVWTQLYGGSGVEYSRGLEVDDEFIYVSASTQSYVDPAVASDEDNTLLLKLRKDDGTLVSQRLWGGIGIDGVSTSIDQDDYGNIYLSGFTTTNDDGTWTEVKRGVIMKVDKADLASTEELESDFQPNSLEIYPNPFTSETMIRSDRYLKGAQLTVYNIYGQAVKQMENITGNMIVLTRDDLPAGLFYVQLREENRTVGSGKIIIQ